MTENRTITIALLLSLILTSGGCALFPNAFKPRGVYANNNSASAIGALERVKAFEVLEPSRDQLLRGSTQRYSAMLKEFGEVVDHVRATDLSDKEKLALQARVNKARRAYMLQASQILEKTDPDLAFWVLLYDVMDIFKYDQANKEILTALRRTAKARVASRHVKLKQHKSYAIDGRGENCVFSTRPFKREGKKNASMNYYFTGTGTQVHVRCYSRTPLRQFSAEQGHFKVLLAANRFTFWSQPAGTPQAHKSGRRYVDASFIVPQSPLDKDDFSLLRAELRFYRVKQYNLKADHFREEIKAEAKWTSERIATSTMLWERSPDQVAGR